MVEAGGWRRVGAWDAGHGVVVRACDIYNGGDFDDTM